MKSILLMFLLTSAGQGGEIGASYVEKVSLEECQASIVAIKQILSEPDYTVHQAACLQSEQKIAEFEHPGDEEYERQRPRYIFLNTVSDGKLFIKQADDMASCKVLLTKNDIVTSWCAPSTQQLFG